MATEAAPLLREDGYEVPRSYSSVAETSDSTHPTKLSATQTIINHLRNWKVLYLCTLLIIIVDVGRALAIAPVMHLIEVLVCRDYYQNTPTDIFDPMNNNYDELCGIKEIQKCVANLNGTLSMLETLPGKSFKPKRVAYSADTDC
jgi:hypothetical protein